MLFEHKKSRILLVIFFTISIINIISINSVFAQDTDPAQVPAQADQAPAQAAAQSSAQGPIDGDDEKLKAAKANKSVCDTSDGMLVANPNGPAADLELINRINNGRRAEYASLVDPKANLNTPDDVGKLAGKKLESLATDKGGCFINIKNP